MAPPVAECRPVYRHLSRHAGMWRRRRRTG